VIGPMLEGYVRTFTQSGADFLEFAKRFTEPAKVLLVAMGRGSGRVWCSSSSRSSSRTSSIATASASAAS
jgi:hypothetical protein